MGPGTPAVIANVAAFLILWMALAVALGPILGTWIHACARNMPAPDPPEYEPDDAEPQRVAETFAESAQEGPLFDPWEPTDA